MANDAVWLVAMTCAPCELRSHCETDLESRSPIPVCRRLFRARPAPLVRFGERQGHFSPVIRSPFGYQAGDRRKLPYGRPFKKCSSAVGIVTQECLLCSHTDLIGTITCSSAIAPTATPVTPAFFDPRKKTVDPHSGQKKF